MPFTRLKVSPFLALFIAELKKQVALNCTPSTFAASAKAQRKVNQLEKELASLEGSKETRAWRKNVVMAIKIAKLLAAAASVGSFYVQPILFHVMPGVLPDFMSYALGQDAKERISLGQVTVLPWLFFTNRFGTFVGGGIAHWIWPQASRRSSVNNNNSVKGQKEKTAKKEL